MYEALEQRQLFATAFPTDAEQLMLELLNRARANPAAEAALHDVDLNEGLAPGTISAAAKQPLAFNLNLIAAARAHSEDMLARDYFAHENPDGHTPGFRMSASGYAFTDSWGWGENLAYRSLLASINATAVQMHADLFIDAGISGRGHRINLLDAAFKEVGVGVSNGIYTTGGFEFDVVMGTHDFAFVATRTFLTGVAYTDGLMDDDFYTPGEGMGGITITATRNSDSAVLSTTTWASGGYSLQLQPGTYTVTASGAGLDTPVSFSDVRIGSENVKKDVVSGDVTTPDATPPTTVVKARKVIKAGGRAYYFNVTYSDPAGVLESSIDSNDVQVTGPKGYVASATLVSTTSSDAGITATYKIIPPRGFWNWSRTGKYEIFLKPSQVSDTLGNTVSSLTRIGFFNVAIPRPL